MRDSWIIDEPVAAVERLRAFAKQYGADEVMVVPGGSADAEDDLRRYPARERTLELLAAAIDGVAPALWR